MAKPARPTMDQLPTHHQNQLSRSEAATKDNNARRTKTKQMEIPNTKRKADDCQKTDNKKCKTTPRGARSTRSSTEGRMEQGGIADETKRLFEDLKSHFNITSRSTAEKFESLIGAVECHVTDNTNVISDLTATVRRIENGLGAGNTPVMARSGLTTPPCLPTNLPTPSRGDSPKYRRDKYEAARKMLRIWPVRGKEDDKLKAETLRFIRQKLQLLASACEDDQIVRVRRTRQPKKTTVNNEVIVIFADKYARDQVFLGAKHLAQFRLPCGKPSAGLRMNYPDHLLADFHVLK